ncbi:MAG: hypothetical protein AAB554_02780 [Patescibacteria group bacterium]
MPDPLAKTADIDTDVSQRFSAMFEEMSYQPAPPETALARSSGRRPGRSALPAQQEGSPRRDGRTLAAMIAACRFDYPPHPYITEANFPLTGSPVADVADMLTVSQKDLGGQNMTTTQIEVAIDRQGFRPATLAEQLAYAKAKWNGKDWVFALGSSWVGPDGHRRVPYPYLCEGADGRWLNLYWDDPEYRWYDGYLFLVVRK